MTPSLSLLLGAALLLPGADHPAAVEAAARDLLDPQKVPLFLRPYTRYLDFSDVPADRLEKTVNVLCGHVNQLSRNPRIVVPQMATATLMRLCIKDYHWDKALWERLAKQDPYFHVRLEPKWEEYPWPGGVWHEDGKYYGPGAFTAMRRPAGKKVVSAAQTHSLREVALLAAKEIREEQTNIGKLILHTQSEVPILDAVWFHQQTVTDLDRDPGYHDFLGFNDQDGFEKLLGFNEIDSRKFSDVLREAVARSKVVSGARARRVEVYDKPGGELWRTLDSFLTKDKNNPLRVLDDNLDFDATEQFGHLGNGFLAWGLFDKKRVRQDRAPDRAAGSRIGAANTTMILNAITCIQCHSDSGVKDFSPWARRLFAPPRGLESADYDEFLRLSRQYLEPLEDALGRSRSRYARAVQRATGLTPQQWSKDCYDLFRWYVEAEVDAAWAARSLGTTVPEMQRAFAAIKAKTGMIDPVLATFLNPEADAIAIDAWEEVFPIGVAYMRGFVP